MGFHIFLVGFEWEANGDSSDPFNYEAGLAAEMLAVVFWMLLTPFHTV